MKRPLVLILAVPMFALTFLAAQQTPDILKTATLTVPALPAPNNTTTYLPYWSVGRGFWKGDNLVFIDPHVPRVDLYDKDSIYSSIKVKFPDNAEVRLYDAIVTTNGHLIVTGWYKPDVGEIHNFIGMPDIEARISHIVDTGSFAPTKISTCDNGATIWALGWSRNSWNSSTRVHDPYDALRQYNLSDGRTLTSTLDTSTFPKWPEPAQPGLFEFPDLMMQCHDKILGIYEGTSDEWIEYDTSTNKLARWKLPKLNHPWAEYDSKGKELPEPYERNAITGIAMLDSGEVFASFWHSTNGDWAKSSVELCQMKKIGDKATWIPVDGTQVKAGEKDGFHQLEGSDGKNLIYSRFGEHYWFFSSAPR